MFEINLRLFGGRGGGSVYSELYKNRLASILSEIEQKRKIARLSDSKYPTVRRKAEAAQRSIDKLQKQYVATEAAAKRNSRGGPF